MKTERQPTSMIHFRDITSGYGITPVIRNITWEIKEDQHWAIIGKIGAGKTTLQQTLAGRNRILSGKISYNFLKNSQSFEARKKAIQLVSFTDTSKLFNNVNTVHYYQQRYQAFDSDGHLTVLEYLQNHGLDLSNNQHQDFIESMSIQPLLNLERIKLSSGQLRKILLLGGILLEPQFLLLDNPHLGLDHDSRKTLNQYIDLLAYQHGQQIIMSGHFRSLPKCITHILHLEKGQIINNQTLEDYLVRRSIKKNKPQKRPLSPSIKSYFTPPNMDAFQSVLKFENVTVRYRDVNVFETLNWFVKKGEKWIVRGPNGAGKSTLISLIYADHPQAYSNSVQLFDKRRGSGESIWHIKKRIGFSSPELHHFFNYNFKTLAVILSGLSDTFYLGKHTDDHIKVAESLLNHFDLLKYKNENFQTLSTGTQRLILLLRALIKNPAVLLLDEPYQGLDQQTIHRCNDLLSQLLTDKHTLIFISHFADEVPITIKHTLNLE